MKKYRGIILMLAVILIIFSKNNVKAADAKVENAINWAIGIANDNSHGYSQSNRWGPNYDCSSFVISAFRSAGFNTGSAANTGNMRSQFTQNGFDWIPWSQIGNMSNLQRGDILLRDTGIWEKQHTEIYLGNGKNVGAHSNRGYPQTGDQTGTEVSVDGYYYHPWDGVLRLKKQSHDPIGSVDQLSAGNGTVVVHGWAMDEDDSSQTLQIHFYIDGVYFGQVQADMTRPDVGKHGFIAVLPTDKAGEHRIDCYAINIGGGSNVKLPLYSDISSNVVTILPKNVTENNIEFTGENINSDGNSYAVTGITSKVKGYVTIPKNVNGYKVHRIAREVFKNKINVTGVYIPNGCYRLGSECFEGSANLESIRVPKSIKEIGTDVFKGCTSLKHIYYQGDEDSWNTELTADVRNALKNTGAEIHYNEKAVYKNKESNMKLTYYLEQEGLCIDGCNMEAKGEITIPSSITGIKVNRVALHTFEAHDKLTGIIFEEGIVRIGQYGLANCPNLKKIVFPKSLKTLGKNILSESNNIDKIYFKGSGEEWRNIIIDGDSLGTKCNILAEYEMASTNRRTISDGDYYIVTTDTKIGMGSVGNNVELMQNSADDVQIMHVTYLGDGYYKVTSKQSGLALDVENASSTEGTNLQLYKDNGTSAQCWIIKEAEDNYNYYIISGCNGRAIDIENGTIKSGTNIRTWTWNKTDAQKWHFVRVNKDAQKSVEDGNYRIISALDYTKGLNVEDASAQDGTNINVYQNTEDRKQIFNITYIGDGFYKIINNYTKTGLFASSSNPYKGSNVVANKDLNTKSMHWGIKKSNNGKYYNIFCQNGGNYLDVVGGVAENKTNVQLWSENSSEAQDWILISDEDLKIDASIDGLTASISWNKISWADEYEIIVCNDGGKDYIKKSVTSTKSDIQLPAGKYSVYVKAINNELEYTKKSDEVEIETTRTKEDQVVNDITFKDATFVYDGKEKNIVVEQKLPDGVTVEYEGNKKTDAGTYTVIARFFDEGKKLLDVKKAKMVIEPKTADSNINVKEIPDQEYTGNEIIPEFEIYDGDVLLREETDYILQYSDNVNTGTAQVVIEFMGNYKGKKSTTFSIIKAKNSWTSELKCEDIKYGEDLNVFAAAKFGKVEYKFASTPLGTYKSKKPEEAGSYYVKAFVDGTKNYDALESDAVRFNIEKAEYDLSGVVFKNEEFTYDGEQKYLALIGTIPDGIDVQYIGNGKINAGEYSVTAKLTGDDNHENCKDFTAKLIIKPATIEIPTGKILVYQDGQTITGITGNTKFEVISGDKATEVGKYEAVVKLKDSKNYIWSDGTIENKVIPWEIIESSQHKHKMQKVEAISATCETTGYEQYWKCEICEELFMDEEGLYGIYEPIEIPATGHQYEAWKTIVEQSVLSAEKQQRICNICGRKEERTVGQKLKPTIKVTKTSLKLFQNQSTDQLGVYGLEKGDYVKSWTSSNKKIVTITGKSNGTCTIKAGTKTGTTKITITLASGLKKTVTVTVSKKTVDCKSIGKVPKKLTLKKKKTYKLKPVIKPSNCTAKAKYTTSNKKIVKVDSKGKITAVKKGKAKITVTVGKKKVVCVVTVK